MGDGAARGHGVAQRVRLLGGQHPGHQGGDHRVLQVSPPAPPPPTGPRFPERPGPPPPARPAAGGYSRREARRGSHPGKFALQAVASGQRETREPGSGRPVEEDVVRGFSRVSTQATSPHPLTYPGSDLPPSFPGAPPLPLCPPFPLLPASAPHPHPRHPPLAVLTPGLQSLPSLPDPGGERIGLIHSCRGVGTYDNLKWHGL